MKYILGLGALVLTLPITSAAQSQPPAAPPPSAPQTAAPRPPARSNPSSSTLSVQVTDKSGNGIADVAISLTGPVERAGRTAPDGSASFRLVRAGTYRLRFEHDRYITLEREFVAGTRGAEVSVALNPAPMVKPVVAVAPPPAPAPAPATPPVSHRAVEPRTLSIPDFLERNMIGSEGQKTSVLGCTDGGTARILQVKNPLTNQVNADADQILYVVAGSGVVRVRDQDYKATPGWFALIPRGAPLGARREGRYPLLTLMVSMGAPCPEGTPLAR